MKKAKSFKREDLVNGQVLTYKGKGFIGYYKGNNLMKFIETSQNSNFDIIVEYIGANGTIDVSVSIYDVEI